MTRDISALVAQLTLDEKAGLTAGLDLWSTVAVPRLGIPSVWVTDGPNGARGPALPGASAGDAPSTAACMPCGTALGATWDPALIERVGQAIGDEARTKACRVLLAPTVNLHRSPLGGRNFESYSEDPLLAGRIAAAFVRGVQSRGVVTTVKHFAGNESEHERMTADSRIDEQSLHELYLLPFELAVREGGALGVMTSYNLVNGEYCANSHLLLHDILRARWGFEGFVVTDWFAHADTVDAARAGLDLEMPGPGRVYGTALATAVRGGHVREADLDTIVTRLLRTFDRVGALDDPAERAVTSLDRAEHRALAYEAACAGTVLLRNEGLLPLDTNTVRTVAIIGPNAGRAQIMGGGSSQFAPHYLVSPFDALRSKLGPAVTIVHEPGVTIARHADPIPASWLRRADGTKGIDVAFLAGGDLGGSTVAEHHRDDTALWFFGRPDPAAGAAFALRASARLVPDATGPVTLSLVQAGLARVYLDDVLLIDGVTDPMPPGREFYGAASDERTVDISLESGRTYDLRVECRNPEARVLAGCKLGLRAAAPPDLFDRAVAAARAADTVIVVVGTDDDWEREGHDRDDMRLPGRQDELVAAAVAANPNTVVVLNCGSPNELPWLADSRAVVQAWFGGQEMGHALADIIFGDAEPGGRLPATFPNRIEHNPSFGNFPATNGTVRYGEGLLVGYRWYDARHIDPCFAFGHGLSYASFRIDPPHPSATTFTAGDVLTVDVPVTNTSDRFGSDVLQCYVAPLDARVPRPVAELKAFAKVHLAAGQSAVARFVLDDRSFSYWRAGDAAAAERAERVRGSVPFVPAPAPVATESAWQLDAGRYELRIGRSSRDIVHTCLVTVLADNPA